MTSTRNTLNPIKGIEIDLKMSIKIKNTKPETL